MVVVVVVVVVGGVKVVEGMGWEGVIEEIGEGSGVGEEIWG